MTTDEQQYDCPYCGEQVTVKDNDREKIGFCPHCHGAYSVDTDAEFESGRWRDLTRLIADSR